MMSRRHLHRNPATTVRSDAVTDAESVQEKAARFSAEQLDADLRRFVEANVLEFVQASDPLGESWVLGMDGERIKLTTKAEVIAMLTGIGAGVLFTEQLRTFQAAFDPR